MARKPIEDIVPNGRSIRNIPVPSSRSRVERPVERPIERPVERPVEKPLDKFPDRPFSTSGSTGTNNSSSADDESNLDKETLRSVRQTFASNQASDVDIYTKRSNKKKIFTITSVIVGVIVLALIVSNVFHSATITVTPRTAQAALDENIIASKSASASSSTSLSPSSSNLTFIPLTINEVGSAKVPAAGEEKVNKAASGTIIIYNNYNSVAQRLVKNTRFETPEGLIYRITESVVVPGKTGSTPGSVEAIVVADATGEKYNVGLKDFTIPGFKGDPRFNTFYARSKTPLAGGFVGTVKVVVDADRLKAQNDIKTKATVNLLQQVAARKTADQVFFDNAYTVECTPLPQETLSEKEVLIKMDCALSASLFDIKTFSAYLASSKNITGFKSGDSVSIENISELSFKPKTPFSPGSSDSINFTFTGNAKFVWLYDQSALKQALSGKTKADAPEIVQGFPMIQKVDVSIRPVWRKAFPEEIKDISILTDLPI